MAVSDRSASDRSAPPPAPRATTKLLLIDLPADHALGDHPEVVAHLRDGWTVTAAEPRIVEPGQPRLLLTLTRPATARAA